MIEGPERLWRLVKAGVVLRLTRAVFQALVIVLLVRMLSPAEFGTYVFLIALGQIISVPAQLGLPQLVVRDASPLAANGDRAALKALAVWAGRMVVLASFIGILLGVGALFLMDSQNASVWQVTLAMCLVPMVGFINVRSSQLRAMGVGVRSQLSELVIVPTLFLGAVLAIYLTKSDVGASVTGVLMLRVAAVLAAVFFVQWLFHRTLSGMVHTSTADTFPEAENPRTGRLRSSLVLGVSAGVYMLNSQLDLLMLTHFKGVEQTAIYRVAVLMVFAIGVVVQSLNAAISPAISRALSLGAREDLLRIIAQQMPRLQLVVWPTAFLWVLFGKPVLVVAFGPEYLAAFAPMVILIVSACINLVFGPAGMLLNLSGNERFAFRAGLWALIVNVGLNMALIPAYGLVGAAMSTLISTFVFNFWLWAYARKQTGINSLGWIASIF